MRAREKDRDGGREGEIKMEGGKEGKWTRGREGERMEVGKETELREGKRERVEGGKEGGQQSEGGRGERDSM